MLNGLLIVDFDFIFSPHNKDFSLLLSYSFVLCKDRSVRSVELLAFVVFWDSEILIDCILSIFMWLSLKMAFAGPR